MNALATMPENLKKSLLDALAALSRVFWGPEAKTCEAIYRGDLFQPLEGSALVVYAPFSANLAQIRSFAADFPDPDTLCRNLEEAYVRLFVSNRQGIAAPLYQSCYEYENAPLMGPPAVAMTDRLRSKDLETASNLNEPPDHISIELEYLYFLLEQGWSRNDAILLAEATTFAKDVMGPWIHRLAERLAHKKSCPFYPLAASFVISILDLITSSGHSTQKTPSPPR